MKISYKTWIMNGYLESCKVLGVGLQNTKVEVYVCDSPY